jgi:hypothetical protein
MAKADEELENQTGEWFLPAKGRLAYWSFGVGLAMLTSLMLVGHLCRSCL